MHQEAAKEQDHNQPGSDVGMGDHHLQHPVDPLTAPLQLCKEPFWAVEVVKEKHGAVEGKDEQQGEAPQEEVTEQQAEEDQGHGEGGCTHGPHKLPQRLIYEKKPNKGRSPNAQNKSGGNIKLTWREHLCLQPLENARYFLANGRFHLVNCGLQQRAVDSVLGDVDCAAKSTRGALPEPREPAFRVLGLGGNGMIVIPLDGLGTALCNGCILAVGQLRRTVSVGMTGVICRRP